ncbi:D-amino acid aminotransferase [Marinomonas sp. 15G1-11]|uniref:branched-chain-amino-acid transaminase n=1 Tax=Marinomonas phaeophyticola TaxID=3004091 RepID=A0ABT4JUN9_9GAMM|nr:D-amino acid aminotransferase [Marinomonas sp. 15G1-11]MCZ2722023.1 D-amino acid aminotransferase [Marinomonas sp. 15G1-11]
MNTVYLNGSFMPIEEAKISPLDRGFLFGDGIYEVIPSYEGKTVGLEPHMQRMFDGMSAIGIQCNKSLEEWKALIQELISLNGGGNLGIYLQVSRGADVKRYHAYPKDVEPTVFAMVMAIKPAVEADASTAKGFSVATTQDMRWKRCQIKSTALLGNVMHFQEGYASGNDEILLYNEDNFLTEASSSNAFIVKDGVVLTPIQDNQILPGITRKLILDILEKDGSIPFEVRNISMEEVFNADEIWVTSSSKELAPVTVIDGKPVGNGKVGGVWEAAFKLYTQFKFDY